MATNPNIEGDGTSLYVSSVLRPLGVRITRLARGLPTGSTIEYASGRILTDAILGRQAIGSETEASRPRPGCRLPRSDPDRHRGAGESVGHKTVEVLGGC